MNDPNTNINRLLRFKNQVTPKEITADEIIKAFTSKYTCENITENFLQTTWYTVFAKNYLHKYGKPLERNNVSAYEIKKDKASIEIEAYNPDESVLLILEAEHCYFETNSSDLYYEIAFFRSVSQYDYDNETEELFELLSRIEQFGEE